MTTSSLERLLSDALHVEIGDATLERLDGLVAARLSRGRVAGLRGWRIAAIVAAVVIAAPLVAVATAGIRHTEDPFGLTDAAGFQAEIDAAKQVVPLPAGAGWPSYLVAQEPNGYSRGGGRFWVEEVAFCIWMDAWLGATESGNSTAATTARDTLLNVPTWILYSSPFADQSYRDVLDRALLGVGTGDPVAARDASRPACPSL